MIRCQDVGGAEQHHPAGHEQQRDPDQGGDEHDGGHGGQGKTRRWRRW
jgi:hypothetical protein